MKIHAHRSLARLGVELLFMQPFGRQMHAVRRMERELVEYTPGQCIEPTLVLELEEAQQLMQELWDQGFRPNNGAGSGAEADALKKHIEFAEAVATQLLLKST